MKRTMMALTMLLSAAPLAHAQSASSKEVTLHGCVIAGEAPGTYAMTRVVETPGASGTAVMPEIAHGRRVLFWLKNDDNVKRHIGRMVEVRGTFDGLKESEIEMKAGRQRDGGLVVEFEGPGPDVKVPNAQVGAAIGTAGRTEPEKDDIKTYLAIVDVKQVRVISGTCK
jgi:hypothetical protein